MSGTYTQILLEKSPLRVRTTSFSCVKASRSSRQYLNPTSLVIYTAAIFFYIVNRATKKGNTVLVEAQC